MSLGPEVFQTTTGKCASLNRRIRLMRETCTQWIFVNVSCNVYCNVFIYKLDLYKTKLKEKLFAKSFS